MRATSRLTLAITSRGAPLGAKNANQVASSSIATPCSLKVGTSGSTCVRSWPDTASARTLPACTLPSAPPSVASHSEIRPVMMSVTACDMPVG